MLVVRIQMVLSMVLVTLQQHQETMWVRLNIRKLLSSGWIDRLPIHSN